MRHLDTQSLWIQEALRARRVTLSKVAGTENPADVLTKIVDSPLLKKMMAKLGLVELEGRAGIAPDLQGGGEQVGLPDGDGG